MVKDKKNIKTKPTANNKPKSYKRYLLLAGIVVLTILSYSNITHNKFINWDDDKLILENPYVSNLSSGTFSDYFSLKLIQNYDALTVLTHALTYKFWQFNPQAYHLLNLLIHLLNVILVYWLIKLLFKNTNVSLITSLLFALHPMRVESVAWAAERKDVLYAFFFIGSIISYLYYIKSSFEFRVSSFDLNNKRNQKSINQKSAIYYFLSLILFVFSLLSKFAAVTLPIVLILIDYYQKRLSIKTLLEKIPFLILSLLMGLVLFTNPEATGGNLNLNNNFDFINRIMFSGYSLVYYIFKSVFPYFLVAFHPYPSLQNGLLPYQYYIFTAIALAAIVLFIRYIIKSKSQPNYIVFGLMFFLINIALVMHIIPFGGWVIVADRYTYIAYIGLFLIIAKLILFLSDKFNNSLIKYRYLLFGLMAIVFISYIYNTYNRNKIWENNFTFWNDIIDKDTTVAFAYNGRGIYYKEQKDLKAAYSDFHKAVAIKDDFEEAYNNCGTVLLDLKDYKNAIKYFDKALSINIYKSLGFYNRAIAKALANDYNGAMSDYNLSINNEVKVPESLVNMGVIKYNLKEYAEAIKYFDNAIKIKPDFVEALYNRGIVKSDLKEYQQAINDYLAVIKYNPQYVNAYNNIGFALSMFQDYGKSIEYLNKAIELKPDADYSYSNRGFSKYKLKQYAEAINDFNTALNLNPSNPNAYFNRALSKIELKDIAGACDDLNKAMSFNYPEANELIAKYCK